MSNLRKLSRCALGATLLVVLGAPALAQGNSRVAVVDPASGQELAVIAPGSDISMAPGQTLTFRVFEPGARKRERTPIAVKDFGFGGPSALQIVNQNERTGEVTVKLGNASPGEKLHVGWRLADDTRGATALNTGKVNIRVVGSSVVPTQEYYVPGGRSYGTQIDALVDALYRGILLREPDASGSSGWRQSVAVGGFQAARSTAMQIAQSPESLAVSQKATPEQRLTALYQNLLGAGPNDIDPAQWAADLQEIQRGNIGGVVDHMLNSPAFRYRFGFYYGR
jgi:hypothetical protein